MAGKPWYTNGIDEIQLHDTEPIPNGYYKGRKPKTKEQQQEIIKKYQNTMKSKSQDELDSINLKRSQTLSKTYNSKSEEEKQSIINKRKETNNNKSEEEKELYRQHLSIGSKDKNKGKEPWNKGLTKDTDERVKQNAKHTSVANKLKSDLIKTSNPNYFKDWRNKVSNTMKVNNSYSKSNPEEFYYKELCNKFGEDDIIRQYKDSRYPFDCDFYIKSKDLFIEVNKHWTHGGHPFNEKDLNDISKLEDWEEKAKISKFYRNAIYVWTDLDIRKQKYAKENNLNYKVIY